MSRPGEDPGPCSCGSSSSCSCSPSRPVTSERPRAKSIVYRVKAPPPQRPPCTRGDGAPKRAWTTQAEAETVLASMLADGCPPRTLTAYRCARCERWHLGNDAPPLPEPYTRRVVDRLPDLLVELGERALALTLVESTRRAANRRSTITQRLQAAAKHAERPTPGTARITSTPCT